MGTVRLSVRLTGEELAEAILDLDQDEILEMVKFIDLAVADYDFTKTLRDHLQSALEAEDAALKEN